MREKEASMMSKTELAKDMTTLGEEELLDYCEHLYSDMKENPKLKLDEEDYTDDLDEYWSLHYLHEHHFHLFFIFFALLAFLLSYMEYLLSSSTLSFTNILMFFLGISLSILSYKISHPSLRHMDDFNNYKNYRLNTLKTSKL